MLRIDREGKRRAGVAASERPSGGRAGFSLVEILVTAVIFVVIASAIIGLLISGKQAYDFGTAQVNVEQEARRVLDDMSRELRQSSGAKISGVNEGESGAAIFFEIPWDVDGDGDVINASGVVEWSDDPGANRIGTISYFYQGAGNQIFRVLSFTGEQRVLANNMASLLFTRPLGSDVIEISVTAEKYVSPSFTGPLDRKAVITLGTQVKLRN